MKRKIETYLIALGKDELLKLWEPVFYIERDARSNLGKGVCTTRHNLPDEIINGK